MKGRESGEVCDMNKVQNETGFNRRDFLKGGSLATLMSMVGGVRLLAQSAPEAEEKPAGPKVKVAVIGLSMWGREILATLGRLEQAQIAGICDHYAPMVRRSASAAPDALQAEDYKAILENKDISAVIIATPTHQHKEIAIAALNAGKHVYCEFPLAHTVEDARAIALAAKTHPKLVFQAGLQMRSDPQRHFLLPFVRAGALGRSLMAQAQWHKKQTWRSTSPIPEREKAINWRLDKSLSLGLVGEIGSHQIDQAAWFLNALPVAATGFGAVAYHRDGREVPDTVQAVVEFPNSVNMMYHATLANSFDKDYEIYYGSDAAVMLRENKAWMFKEVDSPLLGWEVYARKDNFYKETGIALMAGGSKQDFLDFKPTDDIPGTVPVLQSALEGFLRNVGEVEAGIEDFTSIFGADDPAALLEHLSTIRRIPAAGYLEGFQATVTAIKVNEAVNTRQRVVFQPEWYELA